MATCRCTTEVLTRTEPVTRTGTLDNGNPWSVREVEAVDADANKVVFRLRDGVTVASGQRYTFVMDVETDRRQKASALVVDAKPLLK